MVMCLIGAIAQSENLKKLPEKERVEKLIKIAKKTALEYGDSRYWVDGAEYSIKVLPADPEAPWSKKELYRIRFTNDFARKYMEYGYLVDVMIETETGKAVTIGFGNGWGYLIKDENSKTKSSKPIEKMPYQHLPIEK